MESAKEGKKPSQPLTILQIQEVVAVYYGVQVHALQSARRQRVLALPRQVGVFLARELTHASVAEIGQAFGRDATTVLHAWAQMARRVDDAVQVTHMMWLYS
jgi:chromosomal replication initiator protein